MLSRTNRRDRRGALPQRVPVPMLVLSAFIVLGVILGYVFALRSLQSAGGELKQYFDAFLSGGVNRPFSVRALGETLLCYFRAPGIVFLLGFASIGIVAVPLVCACQGFLLSYSLFCFALSLGRGSFPLLLALFGIPPEALPEIRCSDDLFGTTTLGGLFPQDVPILSLIHI